MRMAKDALRAQAADSRSASAIQDKTYHARLAVEKRNYKDCVRVHELAAIFHYWSNTHIRPKLEALGFSSPNQLFCMRLQEQCERQSSRFSRFVSIGSGNCDLEIEIAQHLRNRGYSFVIDCVDLNPEMLDRGRMAAKGAGVREQIHPVQADLNNWNPDGQYDGVIANQSLHHVLRLENLCAKIKASLNPHGCFIISDMIGRNGHQRWPEALQIVHEFWRRLPPSYRFNRQLGRYEELFEDLDCSTGNFEGIRSQDILPLLVEHFHFQMFLAFGNVIDPFVDRSFGLNFDALAEWDRAFIDEVHRRDEEELTAGRIKPTHMLAVVGNERDMPTLFQPPMSPEFCLRLPRAPQSATIFQGAYKWGAWPHSPQEELEIACHRLAETEDRFRNELVKFEACRAWARRLETELEERTAWARRLETEVEERTAWARRLETETEERTAWARRLEAELEDRTAWALRLCADLKQIRWAWRADRLLRHLLHTARTRLFRRQDTA
jgi:SAM-dependent methyltransferase